MGKNRHIQDYIRTQKLNKMILDIEIIIKKEENNKRYN